MKARLSAFSDAETERLARSLSAGGPAVLCLSPGLFSPAQYGARCRQLVPRDPKQMDRWSRGRRGPSSARDAFSGIPAVARGSPRADPVPPANGGRVLNDPAEEGGRAGGPGSGLCSRARLENKRAARVSRERQPQENVAVQGFWPDCTLTRFHSYGLISLRT